VSACNARPPAGHPFAGSLVACHLPAGHEGPHTFEGEPSNARRGLNLLLRTFPARELERIDAQRGLPIVVRDTETGEESERWPPGPDGPWMLVDFLGGDRFAIWKATGEVYRVSADGTVEDDPILRPQ
jgi:hypothetical protein